MLHKKLNEKFIFLRKKHIRFEVAGMVEIASFDPSNKARGVISFHLI